MRHIDKILIANRGEIAIRIMRTCREMGIATVAVFSDADADAPHVRAADEAVRIGPAPAAESYLDIDRVLAAAGLTGADAIHPGYGFLAENAAFARACAARGLVFIGPDPEVIRMLGLKRESKQLAAQAGVPVIPGYSGDEQDIETLVARAREVGFPVLLKASAGGGGKGMRVVRRADELGEALESAKREARSAFGDDTMLIERYIDSPRHIEIQILGDSHGNLVHLFERECSIQRRHQKIIEESPSPAIDPELRARMGAAAVAVGKAVGYVNAGTVELILAPDGEFYFLEVNTRLQVEHPVTESVTGLDLVREQIRVARGESLAVADVADVADAGGLRGVTQTGAAIECRIYAEDPDNGFLPTSGRIVDWYLPALPGVRLDSGVAAPQDIGIHYDPMLAKIICLAPTRDEAVHKMIHALNSFAIQGIVTNRDYLLRVLAHPMFQTGRLDTHFLETHGDELAARPPGPDMIRAAAVAATLAGHEQRRREQRILPSLEPGYRNHRAADQEVVYRLHGIERMTATVRYHNRGGGVFATRVALATGARDAGGNDSHDADAGSDIVRLILLIPIDIDDPDRAGPGGASRCDIWAMWLENEHGLRRRFRVVRAGERWLVFAQGCALTLLEEPRFPEPVAAAVAGGLVAPMPGKVVKVLAGEGYAVRAGDVLLVLEAMKMEHTVRAPEDGVVTRLLVGEGEHVDAEALLAVVTP